MYFLSVRRICETSSRTSSILGNDFLLKDFAFEGIKYEFCSGTPYRPKNFIKRNFIKLKGAFKEFNHIVKLGRRKELKAVFITTNYFHNILFYWIACKIGGVQSILDIEKRLLNRG